MFHYKKGLIETTNAWDRPNITTLWSIWEDNPVFFNKYKTYVYGAFVSMRETWDIDMLVVSDINDVVGVDCARLCNYAHEMYQLIDISVVSQETVDIYTKQAEHYNSTGVWKLPTEIKTDCKYAWFKPHDHIYKNGELISDPNRYVQVAKNLWRVAEHRPLSDKLKARKVIGAPVETETFIKTIFNETDK